jgi:glycosyltransferase involved in cell wall biosynthesis
VLRRFHRPARAILVATSALAAELGGQGLCQTRPWSRGVDTTAFRPGLPLPAGWADLPRPILLNVGRVAVEKNLPAFLDLPLAGTKVVVGDGPDLAGLRARYPEALFTGALSGEALARAYSGADLFVFPSRTDTFGLVLIEAMASGLPVAAYPVAGPLDVVGDSGAGVLDRDLGRAVQAALRLPRSAAIARAADFSWARATDQFESAILDRGQGQGQGASAAPPQTDGALPDRELPDQKLNVAPA